MAGFKQWGQHGLISALDRSSQQVRGSEWKGRTWVSGCQTSSSSFTLELVRNAFSNSPHRCTESETALTERLKLGQQEE